MADDKREVYRVLEPLGGRILIPPRSKAKIRKHNNGAGTPLTGTCGRSGGPAANRGNERPATT